MKREKENGHLYRKGYEALLLFLLFSVLFLFKYVFRDLKRKKEKINRKRKK